MTIVLVILAVLILLAVLFLIFHVSKLSKAHKELMTDYHTLLTDRVLDIQNIIVKQVDKIATLIGSQQQDVVRLTNKVDEGLTHCGNQTRDLKEKINNLETRIIAPIDKINDTHNRIKTLGKGATSTDELRDIVGNVVGDIARAAVNDTIDRLTKKPKTTKKVVKEPVTEVKA